MSYALASEASLKSKQVAGKLTWKISVLANELLSSNYMYLVNTLHILWKHILYFPWHLKVKSQTVHLHLRFSAKYKSC